jgi:hypothetical protein
MGHFSLASSGEVFDFHPQHIHRSVSHSTITNSILNRLAGPDVRRNSTFTNPGLGSESFGRCFANSIPPRNFADSYSPRFRLTTLCINFAPKKKGGMQRPPLKNQNGTVYRPALAAEVIIPAICIPSIRASTFSMLAPVSVHAST